jgi:hypothetical protein
MREPPDASDPTGHPSPIVRDPAAFIRQNATFSGIRTTSALAGSAPVLMMDDSAGGDGAPRFHRRTIHTPRNHHEGKVE